MSEFSSAVVALGMFDGVHIGHRQLVKQAVEAAGATGATPIVFTFSNHPLDVLGGTPRLLSDVRERNALLRSYGAQEVVSVPFTRALASIQAEAFVDALLEEQAMERVVVGYNYTFGAYGSGTAETLTAYGLKKGFAVDVLPPVLYQGAPVSSTRIRAALEDGALEEANAMLGRRYTLTGTVVRNRRIGRRIGFPTANIEAGARRVLPKNGVYATIASVGGAAYRAVTNIGTNPTVGGDKLTIETHLIDFEQDVYGMELNIAFRFLIRGEQTFEDVNALKRQIASDVELAADGK